MVNQRKRISELPPLNAASLDTTFVLGISGSTTYKISINNLTSSLDGAFATDLVTNALSSSLNSKLSTSSFNSYTSSFTASVASGTISGSQQISDLGFVTGSYTTINSFNSLTQSFNSISQSFNVISGSVVSIQGGFDTGSYQTFTTSVNTSISNLNTFTASVSTASLVTSISNLNTFTASVSTASLVTSISNLNSATSSYLTSLSGAISSSSQLTSSFDIRYVASGSISAVPAGTISGSSQLTSSYDSRYSLSGSVLTSFSSSVDTRLDTLEGTIISGSPNYIQILREPLRGVTSTGVIIISGSITTTGNPVQIMVTGDANPISTAWTRLQIFRDGNGIGGIVQVENTSNLNVPYCLNVIDTPSAGTYTYSMRTVSGISGQFDFGEHNGPTLTAVELRTNTNLPSTNNTFTGNNTFNGITTFGTNGGEEGGEIQFGIPQTNTTLQNRVTTDIFQNRFRIFEGSTNAKGVYIDLSKAPNQVGAELMWKASGFVNTDVDVTLGNLKARIPALGNKSLQVSTISGTYSVYGSSTYSYNGIGGITLSSPITITTTPTYLSAGYTFVVAGAIDVWNIMDTSAGIVWRITMIIGQSFNNNFISIERLH